MTQLWLFNNNTPETPKKNHLGVQGLIYAQYFLNNEEQIKTLQEIDKLPWQNDLKRRVQHYGYKYNYKARTIDHTMFVGPLPPFAVEVANKLILTGLINEMPDQLIVNEYQPGQGISAHIDCEPCFKNTIVTVSLGSVYEMDFISLESGEVRPTVLELGSALILENDSRYQWMHRIKHRKSDHKVPRGRRVSLTYRNVILSELPNTYKP
ncbi:MAG: hypothetical protein RL553_1730 [Planctomycetota bacterium]|jgi:alkylated DNA repair dioxygenase AlkB